MAITLDAARTNLQPQTFALDAARDRPAAREVGLGTTAATTTPGLDAARDTTTAGPTPEVRAMQDQLVASRGDDVAVTSRRDLGAREGAGGVQIGVRARVATEGIVNVGQAGSTSTGR